MALAKWILNGLKRCKSECEDGWKGKRKLGEAGAGCLGIIYLADGEEEEGEGGRGRESHDTQGLPCFGCIWAGATPLFKRGAVAGITSSQSSKLRLFETTNYPPTDSLTEVKCRATSVAKKLV